MIRPAIRHLHEADRAGLADLLRRAGNGFPATAEWPFNPARSLVAIHNGKVVGFVSVWHDDQPSAWIDSLVVDAEFRHQGIGVFLAIAAESLALRLGARYVRALAGEDEVVRMLLKKGFVPLGTYEVLDKGY
jgi:GNAT superfamily N-acetyltransferase